MRRSEFKFEPGDMIIWLDCIEVIVSTVPVEDLHGVQELVVMRRHIDSMYGDERHIFILQITEYIEEFFRHYDEADGLITVYRNGKQLTL